MTATRSWYSPIGDPRERRDGQAFPVAVMPAPTTSLCRYTGADDQFGNATAVIKCATSTR
jgi:hypothetical protein